MGNRHNSFLQGSSDRVSYENSSNGEYTDNQSGEFMNQLSNNSITKARSSSASGSRKKNTVNVEIDEDCREELTDILSKLKSGEKSISLTTNEVTTISTLISHHDNILSHEVVEKDIRGSLINYDLTAPKYVSFFKSYYAKSGRTQTVADSTTCDDDSYDNKTKSRRKPSQV